MEAASSRNGMVLKLGTYAETDSSLKVWEYIAGITRVRGRGWLPHPASVDHDDASFDRVVQGCLINLRGNEPGPGETAGGYVHEVEFSDGTMELYWLNVPEAYLTNDRGGTIDRLHTGGGLVTTYAHEVVAEATLLEGPRTFGAVDTTVRTWRS